MKRSTNTAEVVVPHPSSPVDKFISGIILTGAPLSNPQGGAEIENAVRIINDSGQTFVTPQGINRKLRDALVILSEGSERIWVARDTLRDTAYTREHQLLFNKPTLVVDNDAPKKTKAEKMAEAKAAKENAAQTADKNSDEREKLHAHMCSEFIDIRWFGQVLGNPRPMSIRGAVRTSFSTSVDPVSLIEYTPTCVSGIGKEKTMGRATMVPYALIQTTFFIEPFAARKNNFTWADFEKLKDTLSKMYELTNSSTRQLVLEKQIWFVQGSGWIGKHKLERRVSVARKDLTRPATSFSDYNVTIDRTGLPDDLEIQVID